jgi:hypothetical protein
MYLQGKTVLFYHKDGGIKSPGTQFRVIMHVGTNVPGINTTSIFRVKNILQVKTLLSCRWRQQIQPKD